MTQNAEIISFLQRGLPLTPLNALTRFGCHRLAARIYDLRAQGHHIESVTITTPKGKRIASYWLKTR
jgi:hypothetical protein